MFIVWKRPDGYHGATPADFRVVEVGTHSRIWLHKTDNQSFPFRIAGGWQETEATQRLNALVNLLNRPTPDWTLHLEKSFDNARTDDPAEFLGEITKWFAELKSNLKGDTWELEIMAEVMDQVGTQLKAAGAQFLATVKKRSC